MPSYNLTVAPTSTVGARTVFMGLLCTLPTQGLSFTDNESVAAVCSQTTPSKKMTMKKPPRISNMTELNEILKKESGTVCVMKPTSNEALARVRELAIQSDPAIAKRIKLLEAKGIKYRIEIRKKSDSMKGSEDGALGVWDATGIDTKSPLYTQAMKNQSNLGRIESVNEDQAAAVKKLLTIVGNLTGIAPDSPAKDQAAQFKYFLEEVSEVVSDLKRTNAPKALLPGAVSAVFAKYKYKCWDGLMQLAGDEAATELQACADVLLDSQHIKNYLKLVEKAQLTPPGPSCEEFDVVFGLLSEVDTETTSLYRDLIVYLHDIVKPQVDSLDKLRALKVNRGMKDEEIEAQINQLDICIRNYMQCFYNIAQDFAQIERMSVPDKEARLQASMYSRIAGVSRKFWPALEGCLEKLCDSTIVEDIRSKDESLRKHLVTKSLNAGQLNSDEESAIVKDTSSESLWSRMSSYMTNLFSSGNDGLRERDTTTEHDHETMSPMFSDLLEIVEQLKTYGQIASSSPEESPDVPDTIAPGDRVAICGALGFVSKPKAAALFSYLKRLQKCLEFIDYENFAGEEELASIKKFLNVDYHIMKAIQDEGHPLGVHGDMDTEECDKIMTCTFNRYFEECWRHVSTVLEGGDQEDLIKGFERMATDISNWRPPKQESNPKSAQVMQILKRVANVNSMWYLTGMFTFLQGASSEEWKLYPVTQDIWTNGFCLHLKPGENQMRGAILERKLMLCLPEMPAPNITDTAELKLASQLLDIAVQQTFSEEEPLKTYHDHCRASWIEIFPTLRDDKSGDVVEHFVYYDETGHPTEPGSGFHQSKIIEYSEKDGIDVSCTKAFKARWYDATDQVIEQLCDRVLGKTLEEFHKNKTQPWNELLLDKYHFTLTTHYQGPNFHSSTVNSNYEGFVTCSETPTLTDQEALNGFYHIRSYAKSAQNQELCTMRLWNWRPRPIHVFHTSLDIDRDGQIYIQNGDHHGYIGSCVPTLLEKVEAIKSRRQHAGKVTQNTNLVSKGNRNTRLMSGKKTTKLVGSVTESTKPMSGKEIRKLVNAFAEERERGSTQSPRNYSNRLNDTGSFNFTQAPLVLSSGTSVATHAEANSIMTYLPYVAGLMGGIGTVLAAQKAWKCYKERPQEYEGVATDAVARDAVARDAVATDAV